MVPIEPYRNLGAVALTIDTEIICVDVHASRKHQPPVTNWTFRSVILKSSLVYQNVVPGTLVARCSSVAMGLKGIFFGTNHFDKKIKCSHHLASKSPLRRRPSDMGKIRNITGFTPWVGWDNFPLAATKVSRPYWIFAEGEVLTLQKLLGSQKSESLRSKTLPGFGIFRQIISKRNMRRTNSTAIVFILKGGFQKTVLLMFSMCWKNHPYVVSSWENQTNINNLSANSITGNVSHFIPIQSTQMQTSKAIRDDTGMSQYSRWQINND